MGRKVADNYTINVSNAPSRATGTRADLAGGGVFAKLLEAQGRGFNQTQEAYDRDAAGKASLGGSEYVSDDQAEKAKQRAAAEGQAEIDQEAARKKLRGEMDKVIKALQEALEAENAENDDADLKDLIAMVTETNSTIATTNLLLAEMISGVYGEA